jgi:hypothetical protein
VEGIVRNSNCAFASDGLEGRRRAITLPDSPLLIDSVAGDGKSVALALPNLVVLIRWLEWIENVCIIWAESDIEEISCLRFEYFLFALLVPDIFDLLAHAL